MKDLTNLVFPIIPCAPTTVPLTQYEGLLFPMVPSNTQEGDMRVSMEFEMGEQKEYPELNTKGKGTQDTSTSSSVSTLKPLDESFVPTRPSTLASTSSMILVSYEFLKSLVDSQSITNTRLQKAKAEAMIIYGYIQSWVWVTLAMTEAILESAHQATMPDLWT